MAGDGAVEEQDGEFDEEEGDVVGDAVDVPGYEDALKGGCYFGALFLFLGVSEWDESGVRWEEMDGARTG